MPGFASGNNKLCKYHEVSISMQLTTKITCKMPLTFDSFYNEKACRRTNTQTRSLRENIIWLNIPTGSAKETGWLFIRAVKDLTREN